MSIYSLIYEKRKYGKISNLTLTQTNKKCLQIDMYWEKKKLNKLKITHRKQKLQINIHQVQNKLFNKLIYISMHNNKYDSNILW